MMVELGCHLPGGTWGSRQSTGSTQESPSCRSQRREWNLRWRW